MKSDQPPIACTLTTKVAAAQALEWTDLQAHATGVEPVPGGARMRFPAHHEPRILDLAKREATCCAFLDITTFAADGEFILEVTATNPDALPVIELLAGIPLA